MAAIQNITLAATPAITIYQGDGYSQQFTANSNGAAVDLTGGGLAIEVGILPVSGGSRVGPDYAIGAGVQVITAADGIFEWDIAAGDLMFPGQYNYFVRISGVAGMNGQIVGSGKLTVQAAAPTS